MRINKCIKAVVGCISAGKLWILVCLSILIYFTSSCKKGSQPTVLTVLNSAVELTDDKFEFVSLQEAVEASKKYDSCRIQLKPGKHFLDRTIIIDSTISNLSISSEPGERAIVYGGRQITDWKVENNIWIADVPDMDFRLLEVNGKIAERSRLPEEGYFHHLSTFISNWLSTVQGGFDPKPTAEQLLTMKYNPEDLNLITDLENTEITLFHSWDETLVRVGEMDTAKHKITFSSPPAYPAGAFGITKYVVWNSKHGLKRPGQWYLDRKNGKVYYYPRPGEKPDSSVCILPVIDELIRIENSQNIEISNVEFRSNKTPLMVGGFGAKWFSGAVHCENSKYLKFKNITFCNLSSTALKGVGCDHVVITNNHFYHLGAAAIRLIGSDNQIKNNLVHDVGLIYPSTIALYINVTDPNAKEEWELGKNEGNVLIQNNTIYNAPYVGICCGGRDSEIISNRVSRVVQVLTDGGGIYVTFCKNLVLKRNFISDIQIQEGAGTCAYYLDELTNNALVEENLSLNVHRPFHAHLCSDNTIRNNIFITETGDAVMTFPRCENFTFEKNILLADKSIEIKGLNVLTSGGNNILFSTSEDSITGTDLEHYNSVGYRQIDNDLFKITDPMISQYSSGIVQFENESPAQNHGIKNIDVSVAGIINDQKKF